MPKAPTQTKHASRDVGSPFTFKMLAMRRRAFIPPSVTVTLSIPDDSDECPLTLDAIKSSKLDFLPDAPFSTIRPQHSKLTLPCGHSFHALSLIYAFCKNGMRCPCCRAGTEEKADPGCLPVHIKTAIADRVRETLHSEREVQIFGVTVAYSALARTGNLMMQMDFHERLDSPEPAFSFAARLDETERGGRQMFVPRFRFHSMAHTFNVQMRAVRLKVYLDIPRVGGVSIDSTRTVSITEGNTFAPGMHGRFRREEEGESQEFEAERTHFEIGATDGRNGLLVTGLWWCPEGQFMELVSVAEEN